MKVLFVFWERLPLSGECCNCTQGMKWKSLIILTLDRRVFFCDIHCNLGERGTKRRFHLSYLGYLGSLPAFQVGMALRIELCVAAFLALREPLVSLYDCNISSKLNWSM